MKHGVYVDGEFVETNLQLEAMNPHLEEPEHAVHIADERHVDWAFEAAQEAQQEWARTPPRERSQLVRDYLDELHRHRTQTEELLVQEAGSTYTKAKAEFEAATGIVEQASGFPGGLGGPVEESNAEGKVYLTHREPAGVVTAITAWNFPFHLAARVIAPAIALGNAVVLKPAPETPVSGGTIHAVIFDQLDAPDGLVNVVCGDDRTGSHVAGHPATDVCCFTGSTEVGRRVASDAAENLAAPALELGGNSPQVVLPDADLQRAAEAGAFGSCFHAGQVCTAINRHVVHTDVHDEYVQHLIDELESLSVGGPDADVGPMISRIQRDRLHELVEESTTRDLNGDLTGTSIVECGADYDGLCYEPTVLTDVDPTEPIVEQEHFGPVAPVIEVGSREAAIEVANDVDRGLSASVWTETHETAVETARRLEAGMVHVNDHTIGNEAHVPFGGLKDSGIGHYNGQSMIEKLTEYSVVADQFRPRDYRF